MKVSGEALKDPYLGEILLLRSSPPSMAKTLAFGTVEELTKAARRYEARLALESSSLVRFISVTPDEKTLQLELMIEYPESNAMEEFMDERELVIAFKNGLEGLIALHENGFGHGDVRPEAIWFDRFAGRAKLIDRLQISHGPLQTQLGRIFANESLYIPPRLFTELCAQTPKIRHSLSKTDLFCLGMTIFERLSPAGAVQNLYDRSNGVFDNEGLSELLIAGGSAVQDEVVKKFIEFLSRCVLKVDEEQTLGLPEALAELQGNASLAEFFADQSQLGRNDPKRRKESLQAHYNPMDFVANSTLAHHRQAVREELRRAVGQGSPLAQQVEGGAVVAYGLNSKIDPAAKRFLAYSPKPEKTNPSAEMSGFEEKGSSFGEKLSLYIRDSKALLEQNGPIESREGSLVRGQRNVARANFFSKRSESGLRQKTISNPVKVYSRRKPDEKNSLAKLDDFELKTKISLDSHSLNPSVEQKDSVIQKVFNSALRKSTNRETDSGRKTSESDQIIQSNERIPAFSLEFSDLPVKVPTRTQVISTNVVPIPNFDPSSSNSIGFSLQSLRSPSKFEAPPGSAIASSPSQPVQNYSTNQNEPPNSGPQLGQLMSPQQTLKFSLSAQVNPHLQQTRPGPPVAGFSSPLPNSGLKTNFTPLQQPGLNLNSSPGNAFGQKSPTPTGPQSPSQNSSFVSNSLPFKTVPQTLAPFSSPVQASLYPTVYSPSSSTSQPRFSRPTEPRRTVPASPFIQQSNSGLMRSPHQSVFNNLGPIYSPQQSSSVRSVEFQNHQFIQAPLSLYPTQNGSESSLNLYKNSIGSDYRVSLPPTPETFAHLYMKQPSESYRVNPSYVQNRIAKPYPL